MVNNNSTQKGVGTRENVSFSKTTYFVGSWLREFLLSNHDLVGKTFEMKNVCICIELVSDIDQYDDGSVAYRITDTDLSIRAIFTANSLTSASSSKETKDGMPDSEALARSPVVLKECRVIHLAVPGKEHGDFGLEVRSFVWENNKKIATQKVEDILNWAPQYIWCAEDPKLQEVLRKASEKRGAGILSVPSVTNRLGLLFEELIATRNVSDTLFIPPEIKAAIGLTNFEQPGKKRKKRSGDKNTSVNNEASSVTDEEALQIKKNDDSCDGFDHNKVNSGQCVNGRKRKHKTPVLPSTILVGDSQCSKTYLQPFVRLKRLTLAEITNTNFTSGNETSFFFDSMRRKGTLPKWVPKIVKNPFKCARKKQRRGKPIKREPTSVKRSAPRKKVDDTSLEPETDTLSLTDSFEMLPFDDFDSNSASDSNLIDPDFVCENDEVIDLDDDQSMSCDTDPEFEVISKPKKRTKRGTTTGNTSKGKDQKNYGSVYQDVFSKWLNNPCDTGMQLATSIKLLTSNNTSSEVTKKQKLQVKTPEKNAVARNKDKGDLMDLLSLSNDSMPMMTPKVVLTRLPSDMKFNQNKKITFRGKSTSSMYLSHKDPVDLISEKQNQLIVLDSDNDSDLEIVFESPTLNTSVSQTKRVLNTNNFVKSNLTFSPQTSVQSPKNTGEECTAESEDENVVALNSNSASSESCSDLANTDLLNSQNSSPILNEALTRSVEKTTTVSLSADDKPEASESEDKPESSFSANSPVLSASKDSELELPSTTSSQNGKETSNQAADDKLDTTELSVTPSSPKENLEIELTRTTNEIVEHKDSSSNSLPVASEDTLSESPDAASEASEETSKKDPENSPTPHESFLPEADCNDSNASVRPPSPILVNLSNVEVTDKNEVVNNEQKQDSVSSVPKCGTESETETLEGGKELSKKCCTSGSVSTDETFKGADEVLEVQAEDSSDQQCTSKPAEKEISVISEDSEVTVEEIPKVLTSKNDQCCHWTESDTWTLPDDLLDRVWQTITSSVSSAPP